MEAGDLSTQSIIEAVFIYPPYRHVPSLEMTVAADTPLVISTKAERSGVEKSHSSNEAGHLPSFRGDRQPIII